MVHFYYKPDAALNFIFRIEVNETGTSVFPSSPLPVGGGGERRAGRGHPHTGGLGLVPGAWYMVPCT